MASPPWRRFLPALATSATVLGASGGCRSTADAPPVVADGEGDGAPSGPAAPAAETTPAPTPLAPHDKTVAITVRGAAHPEKLRLLVGDQEVTLDGHGHWQGTVHGSGRVVVKAAPGTTESINPAHADLETDQPIAQVVMFVDEPFHQACAPGGAVH